MTTCSIFPGSAVGRSMVLRAPLSFWGGVDPASGRIIDARHPQRGAGVSGRILFIPEPVGSSSSSSVLLELIRGGLAPAGIVLGRPDAILVVGCIAAQELGYNAPPVLVDDSAAMALDDVPMRLQSGALHVFAGCEAGDG